MSGLENWEGAWGVTWLELTAALSQSRGPWICGHPNHTAAAPPRSLTGSSLWRESDQGTPLSGLRAVETEISVQIFDVERLSAQTSFWLIVTRAVRGKPVLYSYQ